MNNRKLVDKTNSVNNDGFFYNLRIKVNGRSLFQRCKFVNCTFVGRRKEHAVFESCIED